MKWTNLFSLIGIAIFLFILFKLDLGKIIEEIISADRGYLLIALFFVFLTTITQTFKWYIIARKQKIAVPFWASYRINLIGTFYGFITPSKLGSAARIGYLKNFEGYHMGKGANNYVLDKVLDLCSLFFLAISFSFVFREVIPTSFLYYSTIILVALLFLLVIFRDKQRTKNILRGVYRRFIPERIKEKVRSGFNSFYDEMPKKESFLVFFLFNIVNWIALYAMSYFIGLSLGIDVSFFYYLAILPIATLVGQIPITVSGLGTREATLISLFGLLGVDPTKVFSMAIIALLGGVIPAIIGSFLTLKGKKK